MSTGGHQLSHTDTHTQAGPHTALWQHPSENLFLFFVLPVSQAACLEFNRIHAFFSNLRSVPIPKRQKEAPRIRDAGVWDWKESAYEPWWGEAHARGLVEQKWKGVFQLLTWTAGLLNEKTILFTFLSSKPKNVTPRWTQSGLCDNVSFVVDVLVIMMLTDMAMITVKKPKLVKEKKKILPYMKVYWDMVLSQESLLGKIFCFVYKRWKGRDYKYSSTNGSQGKQHSVKTGSLMNVWYMSKNSQAPPHLMHQIP